MRMMRLMARSVRLMTLIRLCGSELIEYCCKKITIKAMSTILLFRCRTVQQKMYLMLFLLFQDGLSSYLSLPPLATNKQTTLFNGLISLVDDADQIMRLRTHRILLQKDYRNAMSTILLFRCRTDKKVSQNLFLLQLFLSLQGWTTLLSSLPHLVINKHTNKQYYLMVIYYIY